MSVVQDALQEAVLPDDNLADIEYEARILSEKAKNLLPIEAHVGSKINDRMATLKLTAERAQLAEKTGMKMIPLDVLSWRKSHVVGSRWKSTNISLPTLALVPVMATNPSFGWTKNQYGDNITTMHNLPHELEAIYKDCVLSLARARQYLNRIVGAYFTYTGAIPGETRERIVAVEKEFLFSGQVYLLCDAAQWKIEQTLIPEPPDPIVVGYLHDALWIIDVFNPTPVEEYLALEFSNTPALTQGSSQ